MHKTNLRICGSEKTIVDFTEVNEVVTPEPTESWQPISHSFLVNKTREMLVNSGLSVVQEMHSLARGGLRYFGLFQVSDSRRSDTEYTTIVGLRNSHDKGFAAGLCFGQQVFVCDNLCFSGEEVFARKHTANILHDIPQIIYSTVNSLGDKWALQDQRIEAYKNHSLTDEQAHDTIIRAYRKGAVPTTRLSSVVDQWYNPNHDDFAPRNLWSLHNAFTESLKGNLIALPKRTQALNYVFDNQVGLLADTALNAI